MHRVRNLLQYFRVLWSLKFAVVVIVTLAAALAVGTVLESKYDTRTAQYWVYQARWFQGVLSALGVNILCVALSRWPWNKRHIPFLLAHAGILILLFGGWVTSRFGIDGNLFVQEKRVENTVEFQESVLLLTSDKGSVLYDVPWIPPDVEFKPIPLRGTGIVVDTFIPHAEPVMNFVAALKPERDPLKTQPAVKIKLVGGPLGISGQEFWLWAGDFNWSFNQLGPAYFELKGLGKRLIDPVIAPGTKGWVKFAVDSRGGLGFENVSSSSPKGKKGFIPFAELKNKTLETGWMGMKLEVLEWIPHAMQEKVFVPSEIQFGDQAPGPAIRINKKHWLGIDDRVLVERGNEKFTLVFQSKRMTLPFSVKLESFQIAHDPGSKNPAAYTSYVSVIEKGATVASTKVQMNEPLKRDGFTVYQASFIQDPTRPTVSVFSVNRDPGRWLKYGGALLIVLGTILLFAVKYRRAAAQSALVFALLVLGGLQKEGLAFANQSAEQATEQARKIEKRGSWLYREVERIPVQSGGRLKPLDSLARESMLFLTGSASYEGWRPVEFLFSITARPEEWRKKEFVKISNKKVKKTLLLDENKRFFSPEELLNNPLFQQQAKRGARPNARAGSTEDEFKKIIDRIILFQEIVSGGLWRVVPTPGRDDAWMSIAEKRSPEGAEIKYRFYALIAAYDSGNRAEFERIAADARGSVERAIPGWNPSLARKLYAEWLYNVSKPFSVAWTAYLVAAFLWLFGLNLNKSKVFIYCAAMSTAMAFAAHLYGMALRSYVAGRPPVTNMYESVVWVSFGVVVFSMILMFWQRQRLVLPIACVLSALALLSAQAAPVSLDPTIQPLVPVLRDNFWLTVHVLTITLGYAAFLLALGIANYTLYHYLGKPLRRSFFNAKRITELNQLTYRAMQFGVVLLAAGTILGGVWADYSWGRFWGWDPKETWALIALLCYLAILHARFTGWVKQFGFAVLSVASFLAVLMAWYGVNFVLGAGLHSYGFSSGGLEWVAGFVVFEVFYVSAVCLFRADKPQNAASS
ncbi:MAG: cytochrome c biogenesis protein CcsA [Bdellovibrionota bacterium]